MTCQDHFHQLLAWESERPDFAAGVHHLMVLCYHLQHPSLYSPEGLRGAKALLVDFLERGLTPQDVRRRDQARLDSGRRKFIIKGIPGSHGKYEHPIHWRMTAVDGIAGGAERYYNSVKTGRARSTKRSKLRAIYQPEQAFETTATNTRSPPSRTCLQQY